MSSFDVELMADTATKMSAPLLKGFASLADSHGVDFAASVMCNVAAEIIVAVIASANDEEHRKQVLVGVLTIVGVNLSHAVSAQEADELIARAMRKAKP